MDQDTYEVTREYVRLKPKFENFDSTKVTKKNQAEWDYWKKVKSKFNAGYEENKTQLDFYANHLKQYTYNAEIVSYFDSLLEKKMGKPVTRKSLEALTTDNDTLKQGKRYFHEHLR